MIDINGQEITPGATVINLMLPVEDRPHETVEAVDGDRLVLSLSGTLRQTSNWRLPVEIVEPIEDIEPEQSDFVNCPDCGARIVNDGNCWYCENNPIVSSEGSE